MAARREGRSGGGFRSAFCYKAVFSRGEEKGERGEGDRGDGPLRDSLEVNLR